MKKRTPRATAGMLQKKAKPKRKAKPPKVARKKPKRIAHRPH